MPCPFPTSISWSRLPGAAACGALGVELAHDTHAARRGGKPFSHKKAEKETLAGTRGGEEGNVAVHSVRLPGFVADQEVIFGLPGQTLTITSVSATSP